MKKNISMWSLTACTVLCCVPVLAQANGIDRQFPPNASYCKATKHGLPEEAQIVLEGKLVVLSPALVIRDVNNRIVVNAYLPQEFEGMCMYGIGGALEKVWILTPEQAMRARASRVSAISANRSES